jgi:hypothetical protein
LKDLIDSIIAAFNVAIGLGTLSAVSVYKGFKDNPEEIPDKDWPFITVDDGGERTTEDGVESNTAINRIYSIIIQMAVTSNNMETSIDNILDLANEAKTVLELEANRFKDSHIWGVEIIPFQYVQSEKYFFRGRQVTVEYYDLEDRYDDY